MDAMGKATEACSSGCPCSHVGRHRLADSGLRKECMQLGWRSDWRVEGLGDRVGVDLITHLDPRRSQTILGKHRGTVHPAG